LPSSQFQAFSAPRILFLINITEPWISRALF
jgi:hypothetical protein